MNSNETYHFSASASGVLADFAHLTLYNGQLDTEIKGYGRIEKEDLPRGLYKLVLVLNETMIEKYIKLDKDTDDLITLDTTSSSVLARGLGNTHEYYSERAKEFYFTPTTTAGDQQAKESIFLFFRYPDETAFKSNNPLKETLGTNFKLLDKSRKPICNLDSDHVKEDVDQFGYLIFHIKLSPGTYYLYYGGKKPAKGADDKPMFPAREMPICVFEKWQTQCFMTFGKGPIFKSLFVAMRAVVEGQHDYNPETNNLYDIEGILQKFNNGIYFLPPNVLQALTFGKWENPILGLLAVYAYFKSGLQDQDPLFQVVLRNLSNLLGAATPDVVALFILASKRYPQWIPENHEISEPCMFLPGMKSILESRLNIIQPGSIAETVVDKFFQDMVWTSYSPPTNFRNTSKRGSDGSISTSAGPIWISGTVRSGKGRNFGNLLGGPMDGDGSSQLPSRKKSERKKIVNPKPKILDSWIAFSLMDIISNPKVELPNVSDLVIQLKITPNILNQVINDILDNQNSIEKYLSEKKFNPDYKTFTAANFERLEKVLRQQRK